VSLAGSYHGETLGALAVTDVPIFRDVYAPLLKRNATVASPDARRALPGESARDAANRAADSGKGDASRRRATWMVAEVPKRLRSGSTYPPQDQRRLRCSFGRMP
jgi:adenosylmethionine-8-amino-7-oxononanoate aminotransferase